MIKGHYNVFNLISPEDLVASSVLDLVPEMEELGDTMLTDVIGQCLSLRPIEGCPQREETHGGRVEGVGALEADGMDGVGGWPNEK